MIYTSSSKKRTKKFFDILDDGNFVGPKSSLYLCCSSRKRTVSVSFVSFEKYDLPMRKNFSNFFCSFFAQKHRVWKKNLTLFFGQKVAYKTLVQFTKPWTLYLVSVSRCRGSKMKTSQKKRFFKSSFEKNP